MTLMNKSSYLINNKHCLVSVKPLPPISSKVRPAEAWLAAAEPAVSAESATETGAAANSASTFKAALYEKK